MATSFGHTCVLRRSGHVQCFGVNTYGQLGNGTREDSAEPVAVRGLTDAAAVATGRDFSCALRRNGEVACWGNNEDGQLGNGAGVEPGALSLEVVAVRGLGGVKQISLGEYHGCALDEAGRVHCWGNGSDGQIGNASQRAFSTPLPIERLEFAREIASGASHVCVLERRGTVQCWGRNTEGQLGDGVRGSRIKPVQVEGLRDAVQIASGHHHTCAARQSGGVVCWGDNKARQLGAAAGEDAKRDTPVPVPGVSDVKWLEAGDEHTCAVRPSGRVWCWGANSRGQLGREEEGPARAEPAEVTRIGEVTALSLGLAESCAVQPAGEALCWGASSVRVGLGPSAPSDGAAMSPLR